MVNYFSRRTFVKATSGLLVGAAAAGSVSLLKSLGTAHAQTSPATWMGNVGDGIKISRLSIPGTHESCALHGGSILPNLTICQNRSLQQQLAAGIRFLDIRCRHVNNVFAIHHGPIFQQLMFGGGVRDVCINFLKANPSECIVMSIKEEYNPAGTTRTFEDTFDTYVSGLENFWYQGSSTPASIPTLGEVRGKIVLLRRFPASRLPKGIDASSWPDNTTFEIKNMGGTLEIQDQYNIPAIVDGAINNKWQAIQNLLDRAKADRSDTWYLNLSSGASLSASPQDVANQINPKLSSYLGSNIYNKVGTVVMDFPDDNLIDRIISINSRPVPIFQ
jgi:1-phosphatidylinositol phosphodiesterase